jgi:hypothetical protein
MPVLRIKDINMPETIGGDCRFPLISDRKADAVLLRKPRNNRSAGGFSTGDYKK